MRRLWAGSMIAFAVVLLAGCIPVATSVSGWGGSTLALARDFPDPSILVDGSTYYAFATNADAGGGCGWAQVPVVQSTDLRNWTSDCDALPRVGSWANNTNPAQEVTKTTWAPAVTSVGPNSFILYYTAQRRNTTQQCIGVATSTVPQGPYTDDSTNPLVCNESSTYWSIDPAVFHDPAGATYLLCRQDGAVTGVVAPSRTTIKAAAASIEAYQTLAATGGVRIALDAQPLAPDGLSFATGSTRTELLTNDVGSQPWESPVIEGPAMVVDPTGTHVLLYSAGDYHTAGYAIGAASCGTSMPPSAVCTRNPVAKNPWLSTASTGGADAGPGGETVFTDVSGDLLVAYHAWLPNAVGVDPPGRQLHIQALSFTP